MAFKPTPRQRRIMKEGAKWFAESSKPGHPAHSEYFVEKCTEEMGIRFKSKKPAIRKTLLAKFLNKPATYIRRLLSRLMHR